MTVQVRRLLQPSTRQLGGPEEEAMALRSKLAEKEQEVVPRVKAHSVDFQKG